MVIGLLILLFIVLLIFIIPIKIKVRNNILPKSVDKNVKYNSKSVPEKNYLCIIILGFLPIIKIDLDKSKEKKQKNKKQKNKTKEPIEIVINSIFNVLNSIVTGEKINKIILKKEDFKKINDSITFKKMSLDLGINVINPIYNAYLIAIFNSLINMYIAKNIDKFNLEETRYKTYISGEVYNIRFDSIIKVKFANTIGVIIKIIYLGRKVEKKNGRKRTSNRKFNDDSYDIPREYGRC